jgi:hypothetical protein
MFPEIKTSIARLRGAARANMKDARADTMGVALEVRSNVPRCRP